jgi:predicted outer membrane repeat protein
MNKKTAENKKERRENMKFRKLSQTRLSLFLICVLLAGMIVSGQVQFVFAEDAPQIEFIRQFGTTSDDFAHGIAADSSGIYVVGHTYGAFEGSNLGHTDVYLRKYDLNGNVAWTRQFGSLGSLGIDYGYAVAVDASGVYVVGTVYGELPDKTYFGGLDVFVRKYDKDNGDILWTDQFGAGSNDIAYAIAVDSSGVYVAGEIQLGTSLPGQSSSGGNDCFLRKYDKDGIVDWTRQFGTSGDDWGLAVAAHTSGVYVAGGTTGAFSGKTNAGNYDVFIRKFDTEGNAFWTDQFGSSWGDNARGIFADDSGIYITGDAGAALPDKSSFGNDDAFVRKYVADGTVAWTDQFGTNEVDNANGISGDASGVYVTGHTAGALSGSNLGDYDVFVRKYNRAGDMAWTDQFGTAGSDQGRGISVNSGALYIAGTTLGALQGQTSSGGQDAFIAKYSLLQSPIYVNINASGANDGSSWADAFTSLQGALAAAASGDQIWVAAGTYKPTSGTDRTAAFNLSEGVAVYGGFAGNELELSQRDWETNATILSGDIGSADDISDNVYHVVTVSYEAPASTILDGFTITKGNANGALSGVHDQGGGMVCTGSPTLNNLIFHANNADNTDSGYEWSGGGGIFINGSPVLNNVEFSNNTATTDGYIGGGGMFAYGGSPTLNDVTFRNNDTNKYGGGIFVGDSINLNSVVFKENTAYSGGGIYFDLNVSTSTMSDVEFLGNTASSRGGGIYTSCNAIKAVNALFIGNQSGTGSYGGGIYVKAGSTVQLVNATFSRNVTGSLADDYWGLGGAVFVEGALNMTNSILWDNNAAHGPDIYNVATAAVTYSDLDPSKSHSVTPTNSINSDPLFVDASGGDFRLQPGSPCVDAGTNAPYDAGNTAYGVTTDLDGNPRIVNGTVDMGAYEYQGVIPTSTIIYVNINASGANNGSSWANAFNDCRVPWLRPLPARRSG